MAIDVKQTLLQMVKEDRVIPINYPPPKGGGLVTDP